MKFKRNEEDHLINSMKNMRINTKRRRKIVRNIQSGAKNLNNSNSYILERNRSYKLCRPFSLNVSRYRRYSDHHDPDSSSPTRAYHSDSETVVRKDKDTAYRSQSNINFENHISRAIVHANPPPSVDEQSDYLSSESSYPITRDPSRCISTGIYDHPHTEIPMKRLSLRESSMSLFGCNFIDAAKSGNVERSPSLQHIQCSSINASPCFRTPVSTISDNCDQFTATTTSSRVSCSSGYSHSGVFNTGYSSDDCHLLQYQRISTNEYTVTKRDSHSTWTNNANYRPNFSFQPPHFLSSDVDLSRPQIPNPISCDSNATVDDLSSYMDLMIHIPKMHI